MTDDNQIYDNQICNEPYTRPARLFPSDDLVVPIRCSFLVNHGANHSWYALSVADEVALEKLRERRRAAAEHPDEPSDLPEEVIVISLAIESGKHDPYIELLLAYLHDRKRALRCVPGFPRRRR